MKNLETEFKWNGQAPHAFMRMLGAVRMCLPTQNISAKKQLQITDVYLDHPDRRFEKEMLAFRVRHYKQIWEATFKTRTKIVNGKAVRREETQRLAGVQNFKQALAKLAKQKRWKKLSVQGLEPLFVIRNSRILRMIRTDSFQAELSFDRCVIRAGEKRTFFKEIELEFKNGNKQKFEKFAKELSVKSKLASSKISKVKTAVLLLKKRNI